MAIVYLVYPPTLIAGMEIVEHVNRQLYDLTHPPEVKVPEDGTNQVFPYATHPVTNYKALQVDTEYILYLHTLKNANELLKYYNCPQPEKKKIADIINNNTQIKTGQLLSSDMVKKTQTELEAEGWFPPANNY